MAIPRKLQRLTRAIALLLATGGCAVGPKYKKPPIAVPEKWNIHDEQRLATQTAANAAWWESFNDPILNQLIDRAHQQNLPLQIAGLRIVEARAQYGVATGRQFPQVQVIHGSVTATKLSESAANTGLLDSTFIDYQVGFDVLWELDFWGKYRRGVEAEAAGLVASVADYYSGLVSLAAEVARTYAVIRTFEVLIELAQKNATLQEEGLKLAESRFRNGATSELDVAQATSLLESTRATIPGLQSSLQQAKNALSTLLGQPVGSVEEILAGSKDIPKAPPVVGVSVPAELLRRRPDIQSAELNAMAQCARVGVAEAELYPSFSLFGSIGFQASTGAGAHLSLGDGLFFEAGPRVSWPFFNYGRIENNIRVEDARFEQLLVGYRDVVLRAAQEVEDAEIGYLTSNDSQVFSERAVTAAQRAVDIAFVQYREGAVDYQRVLDAERELLQQENSLAQTRSSVITNLVSLYKALGGGWEPRQGQPVVTAEAQEEMKNRTNWGDLLNEPRSPETKK